MKTNILLLIAMFASRAVHARSLWSALRGGSIEVRPHPRTEMLYYSQELTVEFRRKSSSAETRIKTQLEGIIHSFQKVVPATQSFSRSNTGPDDIHVGKLLSAFKGMKQFMEDTGMSQVARTMATNIAKLEALYQRAPAQQRDSLLALLSYEIDSGVHAHDGKAGNVIMNDRSGAMGLMWLGRNLSYQSFMYHLMLNEGKEPLQAAQLAFQRDLQPHLHWTMAKVLQTAISSLTPARPSSFFSKLGGFREAMYGQEQDAATKRDVQQLVDLWQPLLERMKTVFTELHMQGM